MLTTYRRVLALPGALVFSMSGLVARLPIVDGQPRPGAAGLGPDGLLLAGRRGLGVVRDGQRGRWRCSWPGCRPARPGPGARPGGAGLLRWHGRRRWWRSSWTGRPPGRSSCAALSGAAHAATSGPPSGPAGPTWSPTRCTAATPPSPSRRSSTSRVHRRTDARDRCSPPRCTRWPGSGLRGASPPSSAPRCWSPRRAPSHPRVRRSGAARGPIPWRLVGPLVGCAFAIGVLLGGGEVATVAFADEHGATALAGPCSPSGRSAACCPVW